MKQQYSNTLNKLKSDTRVNRPHVVILGAGASLAAFPNGDKNGKKLPLMKDIVEVIGLNDILKNHDGLSWKAGNNFENYFSNLFLDKKNTNLIKELEELIYNYFSKLSLPEKPTLYDHLILSLRKKDIIATFNWDPLLFQACERIYTFITKNVPKLFFLHGNVAIAIDIKNRNKVSKYIRTIDNANMYPLSKLLYPVTYKNYKSDPFIEAEWSATQRYLKQASILTIFGYSAPKTDVEAKALLQDGWGKAEDRNLEEIELIDIKAEKELLDTWQSFIHSHHYQVQQSFYHSLIAKYPRRSCEAIIRQNFGCEFLDNGTKTDGNISPWEIDNLNDLNKWFSPFIHDEKEI